jgi:hypothetical protein
MARKNCWAIHVTLEKLRVRADSYIVDCCTIELERENLQGQLDERLRELELLRHAILQRQKCIIHYIR